MMTTPDTDSLPTFTPEELAELLKPELIPIHLIETSGWGHPGITDSVEWLRQQRQARREKRRTR